MVFLSYPTDPVFSDTPTFYKNGEYGDTYRTDLVQVTDWLGNQVRVGDKVMYCIGAGHGQMMAMGKVKAMRGRELSRLSSWDWEKDESTGRFRRINEVRENYWEIEIQVLTEKTSGAWDNKKRTRPAWVNPMNVTSMSGLTEPVDPGSLDS